MNLHSVGELFWRFVKKAAYRFNREGEGRRKNLPCCRMSSHAGADLSTYTRNVGTACHQQGKRYLLHFCIPRYRRQLAQNLRFQHISSCMLFVNGKIRIAWREPVLQEAVSIPL